VGAVTANGWLAIIGIATVLQLVLLTVAAVRGVRLLRQATAVVDDLQDVARRLRRADDAVRDTVSRVDLVATTALAAAKVRAWPVFGALQAVRAAGAAWKRRPAVRRPHPAQK
jgi:hypothetical protein